MNNRKTQRQSAKRRRVNSSSAVQNPTLPRKKAQILDDIWLEALKYLTCSQWSLISLASRQVNRVIQRNLSRLPPPVIERALMDPYNVRLHPREFKHVESSFPRSILLLFHPIVYIKQLTIIGDHRKVMDVISNIEDHYIRCHSFILITSGDTPGTPPNITDMSELLKWLERTVRSDSIDFPEWVRNRAHENVSARAMLSDFIFGASQKCKVQELIFAWCEHPIVTNLIEDFMAFTDVQGAVPTVVIDYNSGYEQYRAHLGENLIDREVDSQGAQALYEIESGEKRIRISFCRIYTNWNREYKICMKFYTV